MPLYSYHCTACDKDMELLLGIKETATCPECGGSDLERLLSQVAPDLKHKGYAKSMRSAAAREGHLSNFSRAERKR
jgi:putative FmdB family regulatory protein